MCSPSCSFLHIFLFTNIHNLSISLPHSLALSPMYLSPPLSSATFTVTLQTCKPSSSLSLAHSLALISHPHPLYSLLLWMQPLCLSLSPSLSLSFFPTLTVTFQTCTLSLSLSFLCSHFSLPAAMLTSFISSLALFLSLSLSHHLSLQPCSPILLSSVVDATSLPFSHSPFLSLLLSLFSHTHTLYSLLLHIGLSLSIFSYVNRHSVSLSLSLSLSLSRSLALSLSPSLPPSLLPSFSLISHRMQ